MQLIKALGRHQLIVRPGANWHTSLALTKKEQVSNQHREYGLHNNPTRIYTRTPPGGGVGEGTS